jgi:hypothetical protein
MSAPASSTIQVPPDSTGKSLRTISVTTLVAGVETTVQMQVLAIADSGGNVIDSLVDYEFQEELIRQTKLNGMRLNRLLETFRESAIEDDDLPHEG